jgi:uncharacterized protein (TIRG00374 family)
MAQESLKTRHGLDRRARGYPPRTMPTTTETRTRRTAVAVGLATSALFAWLTFRKVELGEVLRALARVDGRLLALSLLLKLVGFALVTQRSAILLRGVADLTFSRIFRSILLAFAANNVIPLRAGDLLRVEYLARTGRAARTACLAVVAFERLLDTLSVALLLAATLPLAAVRVPLGTSFVVGVALAACGAAALVLAARRRDALARLAARVAALLGERASAAVARHTQTFFGALDAAGSPRVFAGLLGLSLGGWLQSVVSLELWIRAFGWSLPWYAPVVVLGFVTFGIAIPASPGHVGTYHFFASAAMLALGRTKEEAASFALVGHAVAVIPYTLLAAPLLLHEWLTRKKGA